jgi:hypothetical protein
MPLARTIAIKAAGNHYPQGKRKRAEYSALFALFLRSLPPLSKKKSACFGTGGLGYTETIIL